MSPRANAKLDRVLQETTYLLKNLANAKRLAMAINAVEERIAKPTPLSRQKKIINHPTLSP